MRIPLDECLVEVSKGVGPTWTQYRLLGATRAGLAGGKEAIGKAPERYKLVPPGAIFYNPMRILLGSIAFLDEGGAPGITSPDYVVFETRKGVLHPRFFYHWLRSVDGEAFIRSLARGAVRERLLFRRLVSASLDLPPWELQEKAASQLAVVERARAAAEARVEAAEAMAGATLRCLLEANGLAQWQRVALGELLALPLKTGISSPTVRDGRQRCLTLSSVRGGWLDLEASKPVDLTNAQSSGSCVKPGAFYVVRGNGNLSLVGRGAEAPSPMPFPLLYPDLLIQVVANSSRISANYLRVIWATTDVRRDIEARSRTSAGIHKINLTNLASVRLPVPSMTDQERLAGLADVLAAEASNVRETMMAELAGINALPAALLRRAFSGGL